MTTTPDTLQALLLGYLCDWRIELQTWALSGALVDAGLKALDLKAVPSSLRVLESKLAAGDWSDLPRIELLSGSGMGRAIGAWASSTQTIYLNAEWFSRASKNKILSVLTEEFGHYLDSEINEYDTKGDEGELMSRIIGKEDLSINKVSKIKSENDRIIIKLGNGIKIYAEAALITSEEVADTITGTESSDILNGGSGNDTMSGAGGDDTYVVDSTDDVIIETENDGLDTVQSTASYTLGSNIENLILVGTGNIYGKGNGANNTIRGNAGNNSLEGSTGDDSLDGGAGDDSLDGGDGIDTMTGGAGDDTYVVDNAGDIITETVNDGTDTVKSFISYALGVNLERLTLTGSSDINGTGNSANNFISGNDGNNILDGGSGTDTMTGGDGDDKYVIDNATDVVTEAENGGKDSVQSSISYTLRTNLEDLILTGTDDIYGTGNSANNTITGNAGNNILDGGAGDDTLDGGIGVDTMKGGVGDDTYVIDNASDVVIETINAGSDTVQSSINYILGTNVENLTLTGSASINGTGNSSNNTITGNTGNNILDGDAGDDTLDGGDGMDTMTGGAGNDTYVVNNSGDIVVEAANAGADTILSSISYVLGANLENLTLVTGSAANNGTGNALNNVIRGNSRNNTLNGGVGADTMAGGTGNDTYVVDNAGDVVIEAQSGGTDTVQSSVSYTLESNLENLILTGTENINGTGNRDNNNISGNAGNNIINGGSGADTMAGGNGDDIYVVDNADDLVSESANAGTDKVLSSISYTLGTNLENLTLTGTEFINGNGNSVNNTISGNAGKNTLDGCGGDDTLDGGEGDDTYIVDSNGDMVIEAENSGTDTVQSSISYTLGINLENLTLTGYGANNGKGNSANNTITGNSGNNTLDGGTGADTMAGGEGDDIYIVDNPSDVISESANAGNDTVRSSISYTLRLNIEKLILTGTSSINGTGNSADNTITGNSGNNTLDGGTGDDTLDGGAGDDTYVVGSSYDVVIEAEGGGTDTVQTSASWTLGTHLENLILTATSNINGIGNNANNIITGNASNNTLDGGTGADTMAGGTGNDTYVVDNSKDVVTESANAGTDTVQSSISYILGANLENLTLTGSANINGTGNSANNTITGNTSNNTLDGGTGADTMAGGDGNDIYIVDNTSDVVTEAAIAGTDTVRSTISYTLSSNLENLILVGTSNIFGIGNSAANSLTGNTGDNNLDGGAGDDTLDGGIGEDTMKGGVGDDTYVVDNSGDVVDEAVGAGTDTIQSSISYNLGANQENLILTGFGQKNAKGNSANNTITGNAGDNTLDGGIGADTMAGGNGNDTYVVDNSDDVVIEAENGGTDTVQSSVSCILNFNIENLILTATSNINGIGNNANNIITGNAGNNTLNGGAGADTITGGNGNDTYVVDDSNDVVTESANEGTDTVKTSISYILGENLEGLILTGYAAINGTGNRAKNTITGNSGNNTLDGSTGADTMAGGEGNDIYIVDNESDVTTELLNAGTDTVQSSISYTLSSNLENLRLTGTGNISGKGNSANNTLTGNAGNNTLDGGTGSDTMAGGEGDDIYVVDNASDVVTETDDVGTDTVQSSISYTLGSKVENLILTGTGNNYGMGNSTNNSLTGNAGNNSLDGGAGDDTLDGGLGVDTLKGGVGDDTYVVDNARDIVAETLNEGIDTVRSTISYTLGVNLEHLTLIGSSTINGRGNSANNTISGNDNNNIIEGGYGDDTLYGGRGADEMAGGFGDDVYDVDNVGDKVSEALYEGSDTVRSSITYTLGKNLENLTLTGINGIDGTGNELNNVITGNLAANVLAGGAGNDTYIIGAGDRVFENNSEGTDTVVSTITFTLGSNIEILTLSGITSINGNGNELNNIITGNSAANVLTGGAGADTLTGLASADTFLFALTDCRFAAYDRITDFAIGTDILDGPNAVTAINTKELGTVATLDQAGISAVLTSAVFGTNQAATFTIGIGTGTRTFLALNDATAGFSSTSDGLIEITGYSGLLTNLAIV